MRLKMGRMKIGLRILVWLGCLLASPVMAQHAGYGEYMGRSIKSLSDQQIGDLRAGRGMGLALAAELNAYPGPSHVLELAEKLNLTAAQRVRVQAQFEQMQAEARPLGAQLIAEEAALDQLFATRAVNAENLLAATTAIGATQARLRAVHLRTHLLTAETLTPEQTRLYAALRGYAGTAAPAHPRHH